MKKGSGEWEKVPFPIPIPLPIPYSPMSILHIGRLLLRGYGAGGSRGRCSPVFVFKEARANVGVNSAGDFGGATPGFRRSARDDCHHHSRIVDARKRSE